MANDADEAQKPLVENTDGPESPDRREMLRRLARGGAVLPVAVVVYNASTTVATAY